MAFNYGGLARQVIGAGTQTEPADRVVRDTQLNVVYVEKLNDGGFIVDLEDGSQWKVPKQGTQAPFDFADMYTKLNAAS